MADDTRRDDDLVPHARLVPELSVSDFDVSFAFYVELLGFRVLYARPENAFAYLSLDGAELMIERHNGNWSTGPLEQPFGRGLNFEIRVADVDALHARILASGHPIFVPMQERWYRRGDEYIGQRQFLVQDPDGYLLRFGQELGLRATPPA